jgi:hypothetical protein
VILGTCRRPGTGRAGPLGPAWRVTETPRVTIWRRMSRRGVPASARRGALLVHCGPRRRRSVHSRFPAARSAVWKSVVHPSAGRALFGYIPSFFQGYGLLRIVIILLCCGHFLAGKTRSMWLEILVTMLRESPIPCRVKPLRALRDS